MRKTATPNAAIFKAAFLNALTVGVMLVGVPALSAQTLKVVTGNVTYAFPATQMGDATSDGSSTITVLGREFPLDQITIMNVDNSEVADNTVTIAYVGEAATVTIAGNIARYVQASVDGAHVSVTQSPEVSEATCGEIIYVLSGESGNGSFSLDGSYKASLELRGLTLHNPEGAVLDIQNGKRIEISIKKDTRNTLSDGESGNQKGAIVCKGHLEFKGKGTLDVTGNKAHAIYAREYVELKNCTVNVLGAVKDGLNCAQYFLMESGELNISGTGDDGIQTDFKDSTDRDAEDTGTVTIAGGKLTVDVSASAAKAVKAEGDIVVSDGEISLTVRGKGVYDTDKQKTKASACFSADRDVRIDGGHIVLLATGSGGKGISCDGTFTMNEGDIDITTSGGIFAYVNGREYDGYTGNTDRLASDAKSSPKGVKADTEVVINGGNIHVVTTGNGGEGIESKGTLTVNDGVIDVRSTDDCINSSSHMYLKGGEITVISTGNDGLDSNGNLYMMGGHVMAFGSRSPECGIDANEEEGYTVIFTGGMLLAAGGGNSTPTKSDSTQPYVSTSASLSASATVILKNGEETLASFTVPADYTSSSSGWGAPGGGGPGGGMGGSQILVTCPGLTSGQSYNIETGGRTYSVTARTQGSGSGRPW